MPARADTLLRESHVVKYLQDNLDRAFPGAPSALQAIVSVLLDKTVYGKAKKVLQNAKKK